MIAALIKPFGSDNYLVLTKPEEFTELFSKLTPGDEFICRALELSDEEFNGLDGFNGFQGPEGADEEETPEEESTETPEEESTEPTPGGTPPAAPKKLAQPPTGSSAQ